MERRVNIGEGCFDRLLVVIFVNTILYLWGSFID